VDDHENDAVGFKKGYVAVARALENQYRLGVINEHEYRAALKQAGQPLMEYMEAFPPPAPLHDRPKGHSPVETPDAALGADWSLPEEFYGSPVTTISAEPIPVDDSEPMVNHDAEDAAA
jgi:hypothetical protein